MANIGIISTNYHRVPVLKIFCAGIKRLRQETGFDIPCVVVGDIDGAEACRDYDIEHIEYHNKPLTGKFNRACLELRGRCDYVMVMGSDNVIASKSFLRIKEEADKGIDLIGLSEVYFFAMDDIYTGNLYHFLHTTVLGVGRTVSSKVLDSMGWEPWRIQKDRSIDTILLDGVRPYVKTRALLTGEYVFDLKTNHNLNKIHFWSRKLPKMPNADLLWNNIGEEEQQLIKQYMEDNA